MSRLDDWIYRSAFGAGGLRVGWPGELWRVVPNHPANDWLRQRAEQFGRSYTSELAYETSRSLLLDVIYAAGAIVYTVERIDATSNAVQSYVDKHDLKADSEDVPHGLRTPDVDDAFFEYANLLNWVRTLLDRMRSQVPHTKVKLGLIPALSEYMPLRRHVETVFDRLMRDPLIKDEVNLTNFGLHLHALPGAGTPVAQLTTDGRVRLLIPDKPTERVYLFDQFTYNDQRELVPFAHAILERIDGFVNELLTAFEVGTREAMARRRTAT